MKLNFFEKLSSLVQKNDSLLCVGLDPEVTRFSASLLEEPDPVFAFNKRIIDATRGLVCAYKPNFAFYEAEGLSGLKSLKKT